MQSSIGLSSAGDISMVSLFPLFAHFAHSPGLMSVNSKVKLTCRWAVHLLACLCPVCSPGYTWQHGLHIKPSIIIFFFSICTVNSAEINNNVFWSL